MADEYRWLDRETAERLLRGEPPGNTADSTAHDQAERLARTLDALSALSARPAPTEENGELPGEAAAMAAFREARDARPGQAREHTQALGEELPGEVAALAAFRASKAGQGGEPAAVPGVDGGHADAGLVLIGGAGRGRVRRRRGGRSVRFGLAAGLVAGMVGGVAVAAGTGVLPGPFRGAEPGPAASVSATAQPDGPLGTPAPGAGSATPDAAASADPGRDSADGDERDSASGAAAKACRDVRDGKTLGAERRRSLEGLAGGWSRVPSYCADVLEKADGGKGGDFPGEDRDSRTGGQNGGGEQGGQGGQTGAGKGSGRTGRSGNSGSGGKSDGSSDGSFGDNDHRPDSAATGS